MSQNYLKLDSQLCFRLYTASRLITHIYTPWLEELGLTYPQYLTLMVLWEKDGQLVGDISKKLNLDTNTTTPMLKRMEACKLITRTQGTVDRRQIIIRLTEKGIKLKEKCTNIPVQMIDRLLCYNSNVDELGTLTKSLDAFIKTLKKIAEDDRQNALEEKKEQKRKNRKKLGNSDSEQSPK